MFVQRRKRLQRFCVSAEGRNLTMANIEDDDECEDKEQDAEEAEPPKRKMIATIKVSQLLLISALSFDRPSSF